LSKRGWQGDDKCIFCNEIETVEHFFLHCSVSSSLWNWISNYNNFTFNCNTIEEFWQVEAQIPYKDDKLIELIRRACLWIIWLERNILTFKGGIIKSIRHLGGSVITLAKHWCLIKGKKYQDKLHNILPYVRSFFTRLTARGDGLRKKDTEIPLSVDWGYIMNMGWTFSDFLEIVNSCRFRWARALTVNYPELLTSRHLWILKGERKYNS
jgi:zinc-binding in reverse transcriptase